MGDELEAEETKDCPLCGEEIRKAAIKCRHCGEHLTGRRGGGQQRLKAAEDAGTMSLIMAIVGFAVCPLTLPIAIMKGNEAKRLAAKAGAPTPGSATAGLIMGWILLGMNCLALLLVVVYFVIIAVVIANK